MRPPLPKAGGLCRGTIPFSLWPWLVLIPANIAIILLGGGVLTGAPKSRT
jgi:hypothetical protein